MNIREYTKEQICNFEFLPLGEEGCATCVLINRNQPPSRQYYCKSCEAKLEEIYGELDRRNAAQHRVERNGFRHRVSGVLSKIKSWAIGIRK